MNVPLLNQAGDDVWFTEKSAMKPFYGPDTGPSIKSRWSVFNEQYQKKRRLATSIIVTAHL